MWYCLPHKSFLSLTSDMNHSYSFSDCSLHILLSWAPSVKGLPWDWPLSSSRILCAPCPHYQLPMAPVKTSSVSSTDQGMLFSGCEAEWNGNTGDPTMHTVFRVAAERFMLSPKLPPPKKSQIPLMIPSLPLAQFQPFKLQMHNIDSVGEDVKEHMSCGQNNCLTQFFIFQSIALLSDSFSAKF